MSRKDKLVVALIILMVLIAVYQYAAPGMASGKAPDLVVAPADRDRFPNHELPSPGPPDPGAVQAQALGEARMLHQLLRVVAGEITCDGRTKDCVLETDFPEVMRSIVMRCQRVDPAEMRRIDPVTLGGIASVWEETCGDIIAASHQEGPGDTPAWRQRAAKAQAVLQRELGGDRP